MINGRYEQNKPTVIISNLDPKDLPKAIGDRSNDRLREGGAVCLVFNWMSERPKVNRHA
ncbi:DNA replication protein DnaC [compost metagenome]